MLEQTKTGAEAVAGLTAVCGAQNVLVNEPMKNHTSFRAGGAAGALVIPGNAEELISCVRLIKELGVPCFVMGNGTNLLVRDGGFNGVIIKVSEKMSRIGVSGRVVAAEAGALVSRVSKAAYEASLSGLEFAEGIPGSVGGAAAMNAGAYGGEIKDVMSRVLAADGEGNVISFDNPSLELGYRTSVIGRRSLICLSAEFTLSPGEKPAIKSRMDENRKARTEKQPLDLPSAGSTFKRPEGYFAGKLISDAGLRGYRLGGASVSKKHCGFVVNDGGAAAADIIKLIEHIQETVYERFGVALQPEVKIIGEG